MKVRTKAKKYKVRDIYKLQGLDYIVTDVEEGEIADRLTLSEDATDETVDTHEAEKESKLKNIVVEYNGMKFSANDVDQGRMDRAISAMKRHGIEKQLWALHEEVDGEDTTLLTVDDLQNIIELGLQEIGKALL